MKRVVFTSWLLIAFVVTMLALPDITSVGTRCFGQVIDTHVSGKVTPVPTVTPATGSDCEGMVNRLIQSLGPLGILWWYLYYTVTKTLPEKDKQLNDAQVSFSKTLNDVIEEMHKQSEKFTETLLQITTDRGK